MNEPPEALIPPWSIRVRVLFNPVTWRAFPLVLGIPVVLIGAWVSYLATPADGLVIVGGGTVLFAVLWALSCGIIDLAGGVSMAYVLTDDGVYFAAGRGTRAAAGTATVFGALAGSAGAAG
ncbi:MAG: hypothetical protein WCS72_19015, partial [Deltaproteobacteria bacterium]